MYKDCWCIKDFYCDNDFGNDHDYDLFGEYFVDSIRIVRKEKLKNIFNEVN